MLSSDKAVENGSSSLGSSGSVEGKSSVTSIWTDEIRTVRAALYLIEIVPENLLLQSRAYQHLRYLTVLPPYYSNFLG